MKKILLSLGGLLLSFAGSAQVIFYVQAPSANEGNYDFTYAQSADWGVLDMTDPANAVTGEMCFVDDGTAADSLGCNTLSNDLTGKIAVVYRGSCEFGLKAFNAQEAGAIGVIIINNASGAPVAMGGGASGLSVTIPVIMVSNTTGALLRPEILGCATSVFIGSKNGLYDDDLGMRESDILRAKSFSNLQMLSQSGTEFDVEVGAWVRNYGNNNQTGVTLNCMIDLGAANLYDETSAPFDLDAGDSIFVPLPTFTQTTYANGYYDMYYSLNMTPLDESTYDNIRHSDFMINDSLWSYGSLDPVTYKPITDLTQFNGADTRLDVCLAFQDPNASRIAIQGINFSGGTSQNPTPTSLDGELVELIVYEWTDNIVDLNDVNFDPLNLTMVELRNEEYLYLSDIQEENVYVPIPPLALEDNKRYLFCVSVIGSNIYPGYESSLDYGWNLETYAQPLNMVRIDEEQWFAAGFGTDQSPAMSVHFFDATTIGLVELPANDLVAYPNPANEFITIPLAEVDGNVSVEIIDLTGKLISVQNTGMNTSKLTVDVTTLPTGMYTLKLTFEDGSSKDIQVVVSR